MSTSPDLIGCRSSKTAFRGRRSVPTGSGGRVARSPQPFKAPSHHEMRDVFRDRVAFQALGAAFAAVT